MVSADSAVSFLFYLASWMTAQLSRALYSIMCVNVCMSVCVYVQHAQVVLNN